jgi:hypothetical protein
MCILRLLKILYCIHLIISYLGISCVCINENRNVFFHFYNFIINYCVGDLIVNGVINIVNLFFV